MQPPLLNQESAREQARGDAHVKRLVYIFKEMLAMIRRHRMYFLAPILLMLAFLSFLVYHFGPAILTTFVYAGF